ncbi:flagellar filament capping protein FliD [Oxalobacter sp. OttesenSCG-928-P03]|nr:flagellar filament capping protein FliD [Oxalobacter sp. OttesenSCG-928-P03]
MAISSLGVGSGLDLEGIIESLMAVEQRPVQLLAKKESSYNTKLSAYSQVKSAVSTFSSMMGSLSSMSTYQNTNASVADADIATVSANTKAASSSYSLFVKQLAQAQKLAATGVEKANEAIGGGTITIEFGKITGGDYDETTGKYTGAAFEANDKGAKSIDIAADSTLEDIRDAINKAGAGVTASIVNDGSDKPYRLVLTNSETGEEQSMKITVSDDADDALKTLLNHDPAADDGQALQQTVKAQNAVFTLDGIEITKPKNTISDAITGVTLTLLAESEKATTVKVEQDTSVAKTAVENFVSAYNNLVNSLKSMTNYDAETQQASVLTGDSAVRSIQTQLKSVFSQVLGGEAGYRMLSDVGITLNKEGVLEIDSTKLSEAMEKDYESFVGMFAEGGVSGTDNIEFDSQTSATKPGSYEVVIEQVATKGFTSLNVSNLNLSGLSESDRSISLNIHGVAKSVTLDQREYKTKEEFAAALQTKINAEYKESGVSVNVKVDDDGNVRVESNTYGSVSKVSIGSASFFSEVEAKDGQDVKGTIDGVEAEGNGQYLTSKTGDSSGMKLKITGEEGDIISGTVKFTQGFAYQFSQLAKTMLEDDGVISSRIDGINESLESISKQYDSWDKRLEQIEAAYRAKFTALDVLLAELNSQSSYLTTQLESLSSLWKQSSSK